jgi:hypothetical protein
MDNVLIDGRQFVGQQSVECFYQLVIAFHYIFSLCAQKARVYCIATIRVILTRCREFPMCRMIHEGLPYGWQNIFLMTFSKNPTRGAVFWIWGQYPMAPLSPESGRRTAAEFSSTR